MAVISDTSTTVDTSTNVDRPVVTGLDGKEYPRQPKGDERSGLVAYEHRLSHEGHSIRQIVQHLAAQGVQRSVGTVHADLTRWQCDQCSGDPSASPEHSDGEV